ncbi:MAG: hypothetical protein N2255_04970, partial [Kiritimatiellae bacterium]|nr:hypothetical protein [Kiritimatiellia bacterium]
NERLRIAGPVFESQKTQDHRSFQAVRPIYSSFADPQRDETRREFLWPLGIVRDFQGQRFWLFLIAFGHDFDVSSDLSRCRTVILPLFFNGRDATGNEYLALFPFGGTIREFAGRDEIRFVLFPFYSKSIVRDAETLSILWPIFSYTHGGDVLRYRVFPFYGRSINEGRWDKAFIMWPIWNSARYTYPDSTGRAYVLFPIFGRVDLSDQKGWMILPPFFKWIEGQRQSILSCPWPFFEYARGEIDRLSFWPFWGTETRYPSGSRKNDLVCPSMSSTFFCWPLGRSEMLARSDAAVRRWFFLPFLYHEKIVSAQPQGDNSGQESMEAQNMGAHSRSVQTHSPADARVFKLWPLASYRRKANASRFRLLELWPTRDLEPVERNLAPFWTIYCRTRDNEAVEDELLWGLIRHRRVSESERQFSIFPIFNWERGGEARAWSLLHGLLGCRQEATSRRYRILYVLEFGKKSREEL